MFVLYVNVYLPKFTFKLDTHTNSNSHRLFGVIITYKVILLL